MPTGYYLSSANSDLTGGADFSKQIVLSGYGSSGSQTITVGPGGTSTNYGFTNAGDPGGDIASYDDPADWEIYFWSNDDAGENLEISCSLARVNSSGTLQESVDLAETYSMDPGPPYGGFYHWSPDDLNSLGPWNAGDRLRVAFHIHNTDAENDWGVTVRFGDVTNNAISAPWYLSDATALDGAGEINSISSVTADQLLALLAFGDCSSTSSCSADGVVEEPINENCTGDIASVSTVSADVLVGLIASCSTESTSLTTADQLLDLLCSCSTESTSLCSADQLLGLLGFTSTSSSSTVSADTLLGLLSSGSIESSSSTSADQLLQLLCSGSTESTSLVTADQLLGLICFTSTESTSTVSADQLLGLVLFASTESTSLITADQLLGLLVFASAESTSIAESTPKADSNISATGDIISTSLVEDTCYLGLSCSGSCSNGSDFDCAVLLGLLVDGEIDSASSTIVTAEMAIGIRRLAQID